MPGKAHIRYGTVSGTAGGWIGSDKEDGAASEKGLFDEKASGMVSVRVTVQADIGTEGVKSGLVFFVCSCS